MVQLWNCSHVLLETISVQPRGLLPHNLSAVNNLSSKCHNTTEGWDQIVSPLKHSSQLPLSEIPLRTVSLSRSTVQCLFVCSSLSTPVSAIKFKHFQWLSLQCTGAVWVHSVTIIQVYNVIIPKLRSGQRFLVYWTFLPGHLSRHWLTGVWREPGKRDYIIAPVTTWTSFFPLWKHLADSAAWSTLCRL